MKFKKSNSQIPGSEKNCNEYDSSAEETTTSDEEIINSENTHFTSEEESETPESLQNDSDDFNDTTEVQDKKIVKKRKIIIGSILIVLLVIGLSMPSILNQMKQSKYDKAVILFENENYEESMALFSGIKDFEDSEEMVEQCQKFIQYQLALKTYEEGEYEKAQKEFEALGEFRDSKKREIHCEDTIKYQQAESLFEKEDYEAAKDIYSKLSIEDFPDAEEKFNLCDNKINYAKAKELFDKGEPYQAYMLFKKAREYEDSSELMKQCIKTFPKRGETYRNPNYPGESVYLSINVPEHDIGCYYIKIYTADDVLVSIVAINRGDQICDIFLPSGTYKLKAAYGVDNWYGEKDMFGDVGTYTIILNGTDDSENLEFLSDHIYTVSLWLKEGDYGDGLNLRAIERDSF